MTTPAQMISTARDTGILDTALSVAQTVGSAFANQPLMAAAGSAAIAAVLAAAWYTMSLSLGTAAKTKQASAATTRAVQAICKPGALTAEAVHAAHAKAEDSVILRKMAADEAGAETRRVLAALRAKSSRTLLPLMDLPEVTWQHTRPME